MQLYSELQLTGISIVPQLSQEAKRSLGTVITLDAPFVSTRFSNKVQTHDSIAESPSLYLHVITYLRRALEEVTALLKERTTRAGSEPADEGMIPGAEPGELRTRTHLQSWHLGGRHQESVCNVFKDQDTEA